MKVTRAGSGQVAIEVGQLIELTAGEAVHGGWCVARPDGAPAVFVRHALPGERVLGKITEVTSRFARADAIEIRTASPDRVSPPCPHARPGGCGGCDWQHAALPAQRALKAAVIRQQLSRLAGLDMAVTVEALPPAAGPGGDSGLDNDSGPGGDSGLGWRSRVRFAVGAGGVAGLRAHRSHEVIDIGECLIAHPVVTGLGLTRRRWPGAAAVEAFAVPGTGQSAVIVTPARARGKAAGRSAQWGQDGRGYLSQRAAGREWRVSNGAFWQVHPGAADALAAAVLAALAPGAGDTVLDLYCGAGLFAGCLAAAAGQDGMVIGVESDERAVRDARHNLRGWPRARVHRGDVAAVLRRGGLPAARLVVADPPRSGLAREVIDYLCEPRNGAERLAYVSCDPATLARDLGLLASRGWSVDGLRAFDAFPMTHHVECVATASAPGTAQTMPGSAAGSG